MNYFFRWGPCTNESGYGFKEGKPCILIKLNKIFKWLPDPYLSEEDFPDDLPQSIKTAFFKNVEDGKHELVSIYWIIICYNSININRTTEYGLSVTERIQLIVKTLVKSPIIQPMASLLTFIPISIKKATSVLLFSHDLIILNVRY